MKKFLSLIISIFFVLSLLPSCTQEQSDKLQVYVSFYALEGFARDIGGAKLAVTNLVQTGEPHDFEIRSTTRIYGLIPILQSCKWNKFATLFAKLMKTTRIFIPIILTVQKKSAVF